jgi:hypothetical protein
MRAFGIGKQFRDAPHCQQTSDEAIWVGGKAEVKSESAVPQYRMQRMLLIDQFLIDASVCVAVHDVGTIAPSL